MAVTGTVYPVFNNTFKIKELFDEKGKPKQSDPIQVNGLESFSVSIDNGVEEFNPLEAKGWVRRLMTAKGFTVSLGGKRLVGDPGNDMVAGYAFRTGPSALVELEWVMVDGSTLKAQCVMCVNSFGGDSTAIDALEVELQSDGMPNVDPPASAAASV